MKRIIKHIIILTAVVALAGCETSVPNGEQGPDKTIAFYIRVESSVPNVSIETNNVFAGKTPFTLRIFGDVPGSFHDFGSPEYVLSAIPPSTNEFVQTKIFKAGERIPGLIFFDMSQQQGSLLLDLSPDK